MIVLTLRKGLHFSLRLSTVRADLAYPTILVPSGNRLFLKIVLVRETQYREHTLPGATIM